MTTTIAIKDVRREVKILRALNGHNNLIQFYDAFEDQDNVYIIMELCEGGELLDMILSRGGKYLEDDAKAVMVQILNVAAFCHLQGVVHRDLKPENQKQYHELGVGVNLTHSYHSIQKGLVPYMPRSYCPTTTRKVSCDSRGLDRGGGSNGAQQNFQELVGTTRVHEPIVATKGKLYGQSNPGYPITTGYEGVS
ncbi:CDPK-related protein kinase [Glycine soja]|uniref:CDPK-related protein kinase n=1 Tax=Glycine soja TaxID=3848 RepID=A0A445FRX8_GLYSO|nr:CDPK-related protein kinase [Glycine soja]